jgi:hypothetical protein
LTRAARATLAEPGGLLRMLQGAVASAILAAPSLRAKCCRRSRNARTCLRAVVIATPLSDIRKEPFPTAVVAVMAPT